MCKPLEVNHKLFIWLCIYPADDTTDKWWQWSYRLFAVLVFTLNLMAAFACLFYLLKNKSENMNENMFAAAITICFYAANIAMIIQFLYRRSINIIFWHLAEIYRESMYKIILQINWRKSFQLWLIYFQIGSDADDEESFRYLKQANDRNERIFVNYWIYYTAFYFVLLCGTGMCSYIVYMLTHVNFDRDYVFVPYNLA